MYLKRLEMIGFKSFAGKTRLDFEPGMMAIVGPNGCGKSNIADAIRWVLGEQSAKALRGAKMEDVIFAGTDQQKALGMAEVSLTLADCEETLGTEYNEVTVTRRVHRSGEGQYLINRAPCRLKDIQRLFMDTGIGTQSYSLMEQGRIDRILSSRPEDRRSVFEEASGITKFKADRREALRKLDHTEANLLRLADILREVKRQIISLQRQAGKARRYRALQEELRSHELFFTRERLQAMDTELRDIEVRRAGLGEREEAAAEQVRDLEQRLEAARAELGTIARELETTREDIRQARSERERTAEAVVRHRERISELNAMAERDGREGDQASARLAEQTSLGEELGRTLEAAESQRARASEALATVTARLKESEDEVEAAGTALHRLRTESVELEARAAARQKEWSDLDAEERSDRLRRERLEAERIGLRRALTMQEQRAEALTRNVQELDARVREARDIDARAKAARGERLAAIRAADEALRPLREQVSAADARIEWVRRQESEAEGFPAGARLLLDEHSDLQADRACILGALAGHLDIEEPYRTAAEAVLRPWLDAVVVTDEPAAYAVLREIRERSAGSARLLSVQVEAHAEPGPKGPDPDFGEPLRPHVRTEPALEALCDRLLGRVRVVPRLDDVPHPVPAGWVAVTPDGLMAACGGRFSCWMPDSEGTTPVARHALLRTWAEERDRLTAGIDTWETRRNERQAEEETETERLRTAAAALEAAQRDMALAEGERGVIERETREAGQRLETVSIELEGMGDQGRSMDARRADIRSDLDRLRDRQGQVRAATAQQTERLRTVEQERSERLHAVTDQRILENEQRREAENAALRLREQRARILEFEEMIRERAERVREHRAQIDELHRAVADAQDQLEPMAEEIRLYEDRLRDVEGRHDALRAESGDTERALRTQREARDGYQRDGARLDIEIAQRRTRRQDLVERVTQDYRVAEDTLREAPEPAWEGGERPERDVLEMRVTELRAKLDSMGPVNLVAIEEHEELEKRHAFLDEQQNDLVRSKQQLMDLIRRINQTTTALFAETFAKVNENFNTMFTRLFGGGSAKLLLIDEADVLESGIEIIARPPGKKLQSVSLLSGGERTMAAVALLFALYMVKPSPFCLLDELDAALDDANIGRFVGVVSDFLRQSQFIVITHNRQTIAAANALYGVTMERQGISRIVSVRFNREERQAPDATPDASSQSPALTPAEIS